MDQTLSGVPTLGQSEPGSDGNEEVLHIPQISKAWTSTLDGLMSYLGHSLKGAEGESHISADWANL